MSKLSDEQRRGVDNLRSLTKDIERRLAEAVKQAEEVLPPGPIPGILGNAQGNVKAVREVLEFVLENGS